MLNRINVFSPEDVARELQSTPDQVVAELEKGRLKGFKFAGEWRTTEEAVLAMIEGLTEQFAKISEEAVTKKPVSEKTDNQDQKGIPDMKQLSSLQWKQTTFEHFWPTQTEPEIYPEAYQVEVEVKGKKISLLICFCDRDAAGRGRRRAVVFLGSKDHAVYPLVEFTGANDFDETGTMASVIRLDARKQCRTDQNLPAGYEGMPVGVYNLIVKGPYASGSQCVVARYTDLAVMTRHALLRAEQKGFI